jgi:hypothetical protein
MEKNFGTTDDEDIVLAVIVQADNSINKCERVFKLKQFDSE